MKTVFSFSFYALMLLLFGSCKKAELTDQQGNAPVRTVVISSEWTSEASMTWSDTTIDSNPHMITSWKAAELTEDVINNGLVLVYTKTRLEDSEVLMPATLYYTTGVDYDLYASALIPGSVRLIHSKYMNGTYEQPSVRSDIQFRYILIQSSPRPDDRIETGVFAGHSAEEIKEMSYNEVIDLFHISK